MQCFFPLVLPFNDFAKAGDEDGESLPQLPPWACRVLLLSECDLQGLSSTQKENLQLRNVLVASDTKSRPFFFLPFPVLIQIHQSKPLLTINVHPSVKMPRGNNIQVSSKILLQTREDGWGNRAVTPLKTDASAKIIVL